MIETSRRCVGTWSVSSSRTTNSTMPPRVLADGRLIGASGAKSLCCRTTECSTNDVGSCPRRRYAAVCDQRRGARIAVSICEDAWSAHMLDPPLSVRGKAGAELVVSLGTPRPIASAPFARTRRDARRTPTADDRCAHCLRQPGRCLQDELVFDGGSMVIDSSDRRRRHRLTHRSSKRPSRSSTFRVPPHELVATTVTAGCHKPC